MLCSAVYAGEPWEKTLPEVLALKGKKFDEALMLNSYRFASENSADELLGLAQRITREYAPPKDGSGRWSDMPQITEAIVYKGGPSYYARLLKIYQTAPSRRHVELFTTMYQVWMKRELAALAAHSPEIEIPPYDGPLPSELAGASVELQKAWRDYETIAKPYEKIYPVQNHKGVIDYLVHSDAFDKVENDFFDGGGKDISNKIRSFWWGPLYGTGSEDFRYQQSRMLLMAFLHEQKFQEAAGAAMKQESFFMYPSFKTPAPYNFAGDVLKLCGLDWESVMVGCLLNAEINHGWPDQNELEMLSCHGSPHAAELVMQIYPLVSRDSQNGYLDALAKFLTPRPGAPSREGRSQDETVRAITEPVPQEVQDRIFQFILQKMADRETAFDAVRRGIQICRWQHRDEAKETLRVLSKHPYVEIAKEAAAALESMGEKAEAAPANDNPVKFQLILNGKPLADADISCNFEREFYTARGTLYSVRTDANGFLSLDRVDFLDPALKPGKLRFASSQRGKMSTLVLFCAEVPAPENLDVPAVVNATTHKVVFNVTFDKGAEFYKGKKILLGWGMKGISDVEYEADADQPIEIPAVASGNYWVGLLAPGTRIMHSKFDATQDAVVDVKMEAGTEIHMDLKLQHKDQYGIIYPFFFKDGKPFTDYYKTDDMNVYRGFPPGRYQFYLPDLTDLRDFELMNNPAQLLNLPAYEKCLYEFEIGDNPEPVTNLGPVVMKTPQETPRR